MVIMHIFISYTFSWTIWGRALLCSPFIFLPFHLLLSVSLVIPVSSHSIPTFTTVYYENCYGVIVVYSVDECIMLPSRTVNVGHFPKAVFLTAALVWKRHCVDNGECRLFSTDDCSEKLIYLLDVWYMPIDERSVAYSFLSNVLFE